MPHSIIHSKAFESHLKQVLGKYPQSGNTIKKCMESLAQNPEQGNLYPGFGANRVRKMRIALPEYGMGQSKGLRLIFLHVPAKELVMPLVIYPKGRHGSEHEIKNMVAGRLAEVMEEPLHAQ